MGENSQDIIKDALNLKEFSFKGIKSEADSLLEKIWLKRYGINQTFTYAKISYGER